MGPTKSMAPPASYITSDTRNANKSEVGEGKEEEEEVEEKEVEGLEGERARMEVGLSLLLSFQLNHTEGNALSWTFPFICLSP